MKKAIPFILPAAVWLFMTVYMLTAYILTPFTSPVPEKLGTAGVVIAIVMHFVFQVAIVCVLTVIAAKKFGFRAKGLAISLPIMFVLFSVYHYPSQYLFVYTREWSFMFTEHSAMNRFLAAFWITLQFGIIMIITKAAVYANAKTDSAGE